MNCPKCKSAETYTDCEWKFEKDDDLNGIYWCKPCRYVWLKSQQQCIEEAREIIEAFATDDWDPGDVEKAKKWLEGCR